MEVFYVLFGGWIIYSMIHFIMIQHSKSWKQRTSYERFVSVSTYVLIGMLLLASAGY